MVLPLLHNAVAVNCWLAPLANDSVAGVNESDVSVPAGAVTVTTAVSRSVPPECATITRYVPPVVGAVYRPVEVIIPPVAEYVTGGNVVAPVLQFAVAANCCVAPAFTVAVFGLIVSVVSWAVGVVVGAETITAAVSARPQAQFAITIKEPTNWPAVYKPLLEIVPPVAV
jgi:hypothetical protein